MRDYAYNFRNSESVQMCVLIHMNKILSDRWVKPQGWSYNINVINDGTKGSRMHPHNG